MLTDIFESSVFLLLLSSLNKCIVSLPLLLFHYCFAHLMSECESKPNETADIFGFVISVLSSSPWNWQHDDCFIFHIVFYLTPCRLRALRYSCKFYIIGF